MYFKFDFSGSGHPLGAPGEMLDEEFKDTTFGKAISQAGFSTFSTSAGNTFDKAKIQAKLSTLPIISTSTGSTFGKGMSQAGPSTLPSIGTFSTSASSTAPDERAFDFQRLPAELRNRIYDFATVEDGEVDLRSRRPGIAQVCQQARKESLSVYLGLNKFVAYVKRDEFQHVIEWLELLDEQQIKWVQDLIIVCSGGLLPLATHPSPTDGRFKEWHAFVRSLSHTGIKASALQWPGLKDMDLSLLPDLNEDLVNSRDLRWCVEKHIFNIYVLRPLLHAHGMLFEGKGPQSVMRELEIRIVTEMKEGKRQDARCVAMALAILVRKAERLTNMSLVDTLRSYTAELKRWFHLYITRLARERRDLTEELEAGVTELNRWNSENGKVLEYDEAAAQDYEDLEQLWTFKKLKEREK